MSGTDGRLFLLQLLGSTLDITSLEVVFLVNYPAAPLADRALVAVAVFLFIATTMESGLSAWRIAARIGLRPLLFARLLIVVFFHRFIVSLPGLYACAVTDSWTEWTVPLTKLVFRVPTGWMTFGSLDTKPSAVPTIGTKPVGWLDYDTPTIYPLQALQASLGIAAALTIAVGIKIVIFRRPSLRLLKAYIPQPGAQPEWTTVVKDIGGIKVTTRALIPAKEPAWVGHALPARRIASDLTQTVQDSYDAATQLPVYGKSIGKPTSDASDLASLEELAVLSELQYSCKELRLWLEMAENTASIPDRRHY